MTLMVSNALPTIQRYFERAPKAVPDAARMALNKVLANSGRTRVKESMLAQVAFPGNYINTRRLSPGQRATNADLQASLIGRQRPTSLAQFADTRSIPQSRKSGVKVMVHPGKQKPMKSAFLMKLKRGDELTDDAFNLGLAIRLKPGEKIEGRRNQSFNADGGLQLLYGPSVDQVMLDAAGDVEPEILDDVETEFLRQLTRLTE